MQARLRSIRWEAEGANSYVLEPLAGANLRPFTAGAHVDVMLAPGLSRSYSLLNSQDDANRYELGILLAPDSRGGSSHVHERWRVGDILEISEPINDFPLNEGAAHTVLIAGGIGITPILAMAARLERLNRTWELHYVCRTRVRAPFLDRVGRYLAAKTYFDEEPDGGPLDLKAIIAGAAPAAHLYCCGPAGMLDAFEALASSRAADTVHVERFTATEAAAMGGGFRLVLQRSGAEIMVQPGQTMLDAILDAGVDVPYSCTSGICGTCETAVVSGTPDHRDEYLTDAEKATNETIMVCCSGALSGELVLDL